MSSRRPPPPRYHIVSSMHPMTRLNVPMEPVTATAVPLDELEEANASYIDKPKGDAGKAAKGGIVPAAVPLDRGEAERTLSSTARGATAGESSSGSNSSNDNVKNDPDVIKPLPPVSLLPLFRFLLFPLLLSRLDCTNPYRLFLSVLFLHSSSADLPPRVPKNACSRSRRHWCLVGLEDY